MTINAVEDKWFNERAQVVGGCNFCCCQAIAVGSSFLCLGDLCRAFILALSVFYEQRVRRVFSGGKKMSERSEFLFSRRKNPP
jgi:hypothetical protein